MYYWKAKEGDNSAYIPGLGLYYHLGNADTYYAADLITQTNLNFPNNVSAGTDCVGFVERAANYKGTSYIWTTLPRPMP